jgi:hypothetical protein
VAEICPEAINAWFDVWGWIVFREYGLKLLFNGQAPTVG